ncbi:M20/M25/M40 family metallo-hydrolase [Sandaracinobacteroides hominis]|uniref:M20/M25/M40 family metallo-hydrolase n=1 Tax=Sandaracinobacteroides hominis TaxID=2780086 RepID=UPI0018F498C9|nr:M20/M25/M40 family metallo-hydrolase [Sandaracinobacteroides hominis]
METDRRAFVGMTALAGAAAVVPGAAFAQSERDAVKAAVEADRSALLSAVEADKDASVKRIQDWIRHPGIAAEKWQMQEAADYTMGILKDAGFQTVKKIPTSGEPGIFATLDAGAKRTLGVYFMYDVKQVNPSEWSTPPFEAAIVDKASWGRAIQGRGAVNQKGPEMAFLGALHAFRKAGKKLPVNLVLVAEGEEEIASPNFHEVIAVPEVLKALKKAEGIFIPSAWQGANGNVAINLGAKGPLEFQLISSGARWGKGPAGDIHSSNHAMVDSPVWHLVQALNTLVEADGHTPAIDGWFENVRPLTAREKELIAINAAASSEADAKAAYGVKMWIDNEPWEKALERLASQPTVNIQGLVAGYTGPGGKTILPGKAEAKLEARLVPNQTAKEAEAKLRAHLQKRGFGDIEVIVSGGYDPTETAEDARIIRAQQAVYAKYGAKATLVPRLAGSWPGSVFTQPPLSIPAGQFGLGHGGGAHAPNEYFVIDSTNPRVQGLTGATMGFVDFLYEMAIIS